MLAKVMITASQWSGRASLCNMCLHGMTQRGIFCRPIVYAPIYGGPQDVLQSFQSEYESLLRTDAEPRLTCTLCKASLYWEGETVYITTYGYIRPTIEINNRLYFRNHLGGPGQAIKREEVPIDWPMEIAENEIPASPASSLGSLEDLILGDFGSDSGMEGGQEE